jgi:hypothetical protein
MKISKRVSVPVYTNIFKFFSGSTVLKEWTTPDFRNSPSTTNLKEEEIMDALENDSNASMP